MKLREKLEMKTAKVAVIGLGYVGLAQALRIHDGGFEIAGYDISEEKIKMLSNGVSYVETVSDGHIAKANRSDKVVWTHDKRELTSCDVFVICVPTPLYDDKTPNLDFVINALKTVRNLREKDFMVLLESTTFPGTTDALAKPLLEENGLQLGKDFYLAYSPEREDPGNLPLEVVPKIVSGCDDDSLNCATQFYDCFIDEIVRVSSPRVAEATKLLENTFRAVNISLVNQLKVLFNRMEIDIWEVVKAASTKPFGYMPFSPGPGVGGHCIPIDPMYLSWAANQYGFDLSMVNLADKINRSIPDFVVSEIVQKLDNNDVRGKSILVIGLAYKPNISDTRESPALTIIQNLCKLGAVVEFHDPHVKVNPFTEQSSCNKPVPIIDLCEVTSGQYDAVVILTDHDVINYEKLLELECPIIDTRNSFRRRGFDEKVAKYLLHA